MEEITFFGVLRSISSWAKVSRELTMALQTEGVRVNIFERRGFLYDRDFSLGEGLRSRISNEFKGGSVFTFEHPRNYRLLPAAAFKVGLLVYEFTRLPPAWVESINRSLDLVLVPSSFCREVFVKSGVPAERVRVLRYGFNPYYYYPAPEPAPQGPFTFLSAASPHKREGLEFLLEAFSRAFSAEDRVRLLLKMTYLPGEAPKSFEYGGFAGMLARHQSAPHAPCIELMSGRLSEEEMGELYRGAGAYVSLSRCEAFGLCFLEALACGLPVIGIPWSGQAEVINSENAMLAGYTVTAAAGEEYEPGCGPQELALPDVQDAARLMRELYENPPRREIRLKPAPEHWHWRAVAADFRRCLREAGAEI